MEDDKRISYKGRKTTSSNIWHILHTWTKRPLMDNKKLYLYRIKRNERESNKWTLHPIRTQYPRMDNKTIPNMGIEEHKVDYTTPEEKKTLFYKLFSMSKREWDIEVRNHQKKLNRRQREYMLTFRQHTKEKK